MYDNSVEDQTNIAILLPLLCIFSWFPAFYLRCFAWQWHTSGLFTWRISAESVQIF